MKKLKIVAPLITLGAVMSLSSCGGAVKPYNLLCLGDEQSTYDKNFIDAFNAAAEATSIKGEIGFKKGLKENENDVYNEAKTEASFNPKLIMTNSYGHQDGLIKAAKEFPDIQFISCTGDTAIVSENVIGSKLSNYHNAFAKIHEGRFLTGIVAGYNIKDRIGKQFGNFSAIDPNNDIYVGYVGAKPYAEVKSGFSAFYLGIKYALKDQTYVDKIKMKVAYSGEWNDVTKEQDKASVLIDTHKCVLISQHADSIGAPNVCESNNVPNIGYNKGNMTECPKTYLVSSRINWTPYYIDVINKIKEGKGSEIAVDYSGDLNSESVKLCDYNTNESIVTKECKTAVEDATKLLKEGKLQVFDTSTFKVIMNDDKTKTPKKLDENYEAHTWSSDYKTKYKTAKVITTNGGIQYFDESNPNLLRSSPYFGADFIVEGITELSDK